MLLCTVLVRCTPRGFPLPRPRARVLAFGAEVEVRPRGGLPVLALARPRHLAVHGGAVREIRVRTCTSSRLLFMELSLSLAMCIVNRGLPLRIGSLAVAGIFSNFLRVEVIGCYKGVSRRFRSFDLTCYFPCNRSATLVQPFYVAGATSTTGVACCEVQRS